MYRGFNQEDFMLASTVRYLLKSHGPLPFVKMIKKIQKFINRHTSEMSVSLFFLISQYAL